MIDILFINLTVNVGNNHCKKSICVRAGTDMMDMTNIQTYICMKKNRFIDIRNNGILLNVRIYNQSTP